VLVDSLGLGIFVFTDFTSSVFSGLFQGKLRFAVGKTRQDQTLRGR
jgi:hypothetical protein